MTFKKVNKKGSKISIDGNLQREIVCWSNKDDY